VYGAAHKPGDLARLVDDLAAALLAG